MDHQIIKQIVEDVFEKAKTGCPVHSVNALTNFIEEQSKLSYKTLERAHKKYIGNENTDWSPNSGSVNHFCEFLNYKNFQDFVQKNVETNKESPIAETVEIKEGKEVFKQASRLDTQDLDKKSKAKNRWFVMGGILLFGIFALFVSQNLLSDNTIPAKECMAWAGDHYENMDCGLKWHPIFKTKVENLAADRKKNMKKIDVTAATPFFSEETGKPLIWYYKGNNGVFEYFTSPGLHPINGETLKKITPTIIQKYVPTHELNKDSFLRDE